jgi:hypothetical protein
MQQNQELNIQIKTAGPIKTKPNALQPSYLAASVETTISSKIVSLLYEPDKKGR